MASRKRTTNKLKILGSGGYYPTPKRQTACYLLNDNIVIDAGSGILKILDDPIASDLHILLSHIHIDHVLGLAYLYGAKEHLKAKPKVYCSAEEWDYLSTHLFASRLFDPAIDFLDFVEIKEVFEIDGITIKCIPQAHGTYGSRGFIFDSFLAYFTDTQLRKELECSVKLLLHEAYSLDRNTAAHCSVTSVKELFARSTCEQLGIIHINPNFSDEDERRMWELSEGVNRFVATDGLEIAL